MNTLLSTIFKFCTSKNLFRYFCCWDILVVHHRILNSLQNFHSLQSNYLRKLECLFRLLYLITCLNVYRLLIFLVTILKSKAPPLRLGYSSNAATDSIQADPMLHPIFSKDSPRLMSYEPMALGTKI